VSGSRVAVRREGEACVLTLQREEKLNALSGALERELLDALSSDDVRASRCVVLTGAGKAFSAGADINEFAGTDPASIAAYYADTGDVYERLAALPVPTISAIHGWCLGGGLEMALATDFRIADETAAFGLPEVELGILPSSGGTYRLVRLVRRRRCPRARARHGGRPGGEGARPGARDRRGAGLAAGPRRRDDEAGRGPHARVLARGRDADRAPRLCRTRADWRGQGRGRGL